ncbi:cytochrome P450 [Sphingobium sp. DEHP117]|uniref:cytochrome P450 n=1 Tax=Sphingobium sp. DEHP117 TaxID=2993436 RepID=UPI0027D73CFC|nr:cytochrome P450 [Sphingobium sp. DEHP117]MDQ4420392.1 cytochrome P450 [Sphingobium sp. DEHP117]
MGSDATRALAERPAHVPANLVQDFDFWTIANGVDDLHAAYSAVQKNALDIFWTPRNGGHWVATRADDIRRMQLDYKLFSHKEVRLPPVGPEQPLLIPVELDPPEHTPYRRILTQYLTPRAIAAMEDSVRKVTVETIEQLVPNGGCEFMSAFSQIIPIVVFFSLVDVPVSEKDELLALADAGLHGETAEAQWEAQLRMFEYLGRWVRKRREHPGKDLLSMMVNLEIDDELIEEAEAVSFAALVFFGGLDTVAAMMGFIALFLAEHPQHRRQLAERLDDKAFLKRAVEEFIRRHGLANTGRVITQDLEYNGIQFKAGDHILPANVFAGLDERRNPDPLAVDFDRVNGVHAAFGNGPHACPGAALARRELIIFLEEWLSRIPEFSLKPGTWPTMVSGSVNGLQSLELVW